MSEDRELILLQALQAGFDALARHEIEPLLDGFEPDVEFNLVGLPGLGLEQRYAGHDGWFEWAADIFETWTDPTWRVRRVVDGGDRFVAEIDLTARGKASGAEVTLNWAAVYYLSPRGKLARQDSFFQDGWISALKAAGLSE